MGQVTHKSHKLRILLSKEPSGVKDYCFCIPPIILYLLYFNVLVYYYFYFLFFFVMYVCLCVAWLKLS